MSKKGISHSITRLRRRLRRSRTARILWLVVSWQPFTWFGWIGIALATLAVRALAIPEFDLVANILGMSFLGLAATLLVAGFAVRVRLGRVLQGDLKFDLSGGGAGHPLSGKHIDSGIILQNASLPPLFTLRIQREFEHDGPDSPIHIVRGRGSDEGRRVLIDTVKFPHRGYWAVRSLRAEVRDDFGIISFSWNIPIDSGLEVSAPLIPIRSLPIVAASSRAGDELHLSHERSGDLFDIKPYDPSDGVKRILWKTYAKSGQLVVRRPEPAVIPEGEVAVYLVAGADEDHVAGALLGYLNQLEESRVVVLFGTDGFGSMKGPAFYHDPRRPHAAPNNAFTSVPQQMLSAMNQSVWNELAGTGRGFGRYLQALDEATRRVSQVIVFGPGGGSDSGGEWLNEITRTAAAAHVKLAIAIVPRTVDPVFAAARRLAQAQERTVYGKAKKNLVRALPARIRPEVDTGRIDRGVLNNLYGRARSSGSEVMEVQPFDSAF